MYGKLHKNPILSLVFAGFIAFLPTDPGPHLSNNEPSSQFQTARIVGVALPPASAISTPRAQPTWVSAAAKQNTHYSVTRAFFSTPGFQFWRCGSEADRTYWLKPRQSGHKCNRAPPQSDSR
jgi:hypothetical protein